MSKQHIFRASVRSGLLIAVISILISCGGGSGSAGGGSSTDTPTIDTPTITERTVFTNPTDSMLYSFSTDNGEKFTYRGRRDQSGMASVITMLDYVDTAGDTYQIFFDNQGLPAKVVDEQGTTIEFEYRSTNSSVPSDSLNSPSEGDQINISFELSSKNRSVQSTSLKPTSEVDLTSIESMGVSIVTMGSNEIPLSVQTRIVLDDPVVVDLNQISPELLESTGNVTINVSKCSKPINPKGGVVVNFRRPGELSGITRYPAEATNQPGQFVASIPTTGAGPVSAADVEAICTAFADTLDKACHVFNPVTTGLGAGGVLLSDPGFQIATCASVTAAVSAAATPAVGLTAGTACLTLLVGGTATCKTLGFGFDPTPDGKNVTQKLCGQVEKSLNAYESAAGAGTVYIQAWADFADGKTVSSTDEFEVSAYGPFPDLYINSLEPMVGELSISPGLPEVGQGYYATADLSCVGGAELSMVVSRDGGEPLVDKQIPYYNHNGTISAPVPSWPRGDADTLVVSAKNTAPGLPYNKVSKIFGVKFVEANTRPVADNKSVTTSQDTSVAITLSGSDGDGDALTYTVVSQPANGTLSGTAPNLTYRPNSAYVGTDSFAFKVGDNKINSADATVSITIEDDADPAYVFDKNSCPTSLKGKYVYGDGTLIDIPFSHFEDNWFMDEANCYYTQKEIPIPNPGWNPEIGFSSGLWFEYDGNYNGLVQQETCPGDSGNSGVTVELQEWAETVIVTSNIRNVSVRAFYNDNIYEYDYQNLVDAMKVLIDNAVKARIGSCK